MPAAPNGASFETGHADMVHDTQLDYYGRVRRLPGPRLCASLCSSATHSLVSSHTLFFSSLQRLATCSSDRVIKVFDVAGDSRTHVADLTGHTGPVRPLASGASLSRSTRPRSSVTLTSHAHTYILPSDTALDCPCPTPGVASQLGPPQVWPLACKLLVRPTGARLLLWFTRLHSMAL